LKSPHPSSKGYKLSSLLFCLYHNWSKLLISFSECAVLILDMILFCFSVWMLLAIVFDFVATRVFKISSKFLTDMAIKLFKKYFKHVDCKQGMSYISLCVYRIKY